MRYIVIDRRKDGTGDWFTNEHDDKQEAMKQAVSDWNHLTYREKKVREIFVLESVNPDEEAPDHFDGNPIWESGPAVF